MKNLNQLKNNSKQAAKLLKAIAHSERLLILCQLVAGELNVGELLQSSTLSPSAFSQHLAVLRKYKLVKVRKVMQTVFYSLANDDVIKIIATLHQIYCPKK
jgi:ArsR family transcriptional regulator, virulence genes transcriptional regulator